MTSTTHEPRIGVRTLRAKLSATLRRVRTERERILVLDARGKSVAALVTVEDLAALEAMEDRIDAEEATKVLAEMKAKGEKPIPWEKVKERLGL